MCRVAEALARKALRLKLPSRPIIPSIISEAKAPGAMQLTLMSKRAHSTANTSVMRAIPDLVIEYSAAPLPE